MKRHNPTDKDSISDAKTMPSAVNRFGKTDVRYWGSRIFRRRRPSGQVDADWTAQIQYLGRREQFALGTPNKAAAAAKARDIYVSLHGRGWDESLRLYKPKREEAKPEQSTVGDVIREVAAKTHYRLTTFSVYCAALRRIAADIAEVPSRPGRFSPGSTANSEWRALVDATSLSLLTEDAIQQWKLDYIKSRESSPDARYRALSTVNAHIRNARSLFTPEALKLARVRLALPDPLPFAGVALERGGRTPKYQSRIDARALIKEASLELGADRKRLEQYKIFCLGLLCGLRKREIDSLLWRSVDFEKAVIRIERTEYFQPKTDDSVAEVDIAAELAALLRDWKKKTKGEFVIESKNQPAYGKSRSNYRAEAEFQRLYAWLGHKGLTARKKLHELRKECGSVIANTQGIFAASHALRHSDIRMTSQSYTDKKVPITTGLDSLLISVKRQRLG